LQGASWGKDFYRALVRRPDDICELLAYHFAAGQKLSNAMKKGLGASFGKFNAYNLAKYKGEGKAVSLVDAANLLHPKPTENNAEALRMLLKGELKSTDTWESELAAAGQVGGDETDKGAAKQAVWTRLLTERKLGYFALLRNLRNIIAQAPAMVEVAAAQLVDTAAIAQSLVLPFRYLTAYDELNKLPSTYEQRTLIVALNQAVELSLVNVPRFAGRTLVVLDVSGSMGHGEGLPAKVGGLFTAVLVKSNNADLITFAEYARYQQVDPLLSTIGLSQQLRFTGGGTNFASAFEAAKAGYDRVILLSDMQGWMVTPGYNATSSPVPAFNDYCARTGTKPFVYSFDLLGGGTMQFPQNRVLCLAGFSEKLLGIMAELEQDPHALVNAIKQVSFAG
jgi:60 kDa SS-A/Ro ribonucleoprotein